MALVADQLLAAARQQTGLTELGDASILDGLERLVTALDREARLTEAGRQRMEASIVGTLANRLRVEHHLARHPELLRRPIERPLFLFGLPRTGTTLAINLLSADPARRCLLRWEAFNSVPPPRPDELHGGPRYQQEQTRLDYATKMAPQISAIHHENADSPTECQFAMTPSFCAQVYDAGAYIPSYHRWFLHTSYLPAFRYHKRLLQLLQSDAPGRWTLKNPWHPLFLDDLIQVYPDAQLVMTHRDPVEVVGSACSLLKHVRVMYSDEVDLRAIGACMMETFDLMIERTLAYKARHGWSSIYDLQYADLMRDPVGEMRKLYQHFGEPFSAAAEQGMRQHLADNPQGKHGKHTYALEDYGLSMAAVRKHYADYCRRFDISCKP